MRVPGCIMTSVLVEYKRLMASEYLFYSLGEFRFSLTLRKDYSRLATSEHDG